MNKSTIEDFENNMTIFYFKSSGKIHSWYTGIHNLSSFGEHEADYKLVLDCLVLPFDKYVLDNYRYFSVMEIDEDGDKKKKLQFNSPASNYILK